MMNDNELADLARQFHDTYERLAPEFGYTTQEATAVPWEDVPENNRLLMEATVEAVVGARLRELSAEVDVLRRLGLHHDVAALEDRFKKLVEVEAENERLRHQITIHGSPCMRCGKTMVADNRMICMCGRDTVDRHNEWLAEWQRLHNP